jgi:Fur family iron response transcriptional regulator
VWERVRRDLPVVSRATVYNTLNLFVDKGLLRELVLAEGKVVFDPKVERHHHFIDEQTGRIHDVPWDALSVARVDELSGFEVHEYQVVLRGRRAPARRR